MATVSRSEQQTAEAFERQGMSPWRARHAAAVVHGTAADVNAVHDWAGDDRRTLDEIVAGDQSLGTPVPPAISLPASGPQ